MPSIPPVEGDYFFSCYNLFTGWPTWLRALSLFDDDMRPVSDGSLGRILAATFEQQRARWYWQYILRRTQSGLINSWGYRRMLSCLANFMMAAFPRATLLENERNRCRRIPRVVQGQHRGALGTLRPDVVELLLTRENATLMALFSYAAGMTRKKTAILINLFRKTIRK